MSKDPARKKASRRRRFRLIPHTADIGLIAYGEDLAEAYGNAAYGLFSIITDLRRVRETQSRTLEVNEESPESLLYQWLNDLIYIFDTELFIYKRFDITEFDTRHLRAKCYGEKYDPARHRLKTGVKAATYHMLTVDREKNRVQVIFDV